MLPQLRHLPEVFPADLQDSMDRVPQSDILVLLGTFIARVGKHDNESGLWSGTLGKHGLHSLRNVP